MGNGTVPATELVTVQTGIELARDAANDWIAMRDAAAKAGVKMSIAEPLGGYRSLAQQRSLKANPRAYGSDLPASEIAAAGYSTHGLGENVDIVPPAAVAWAEKHGAAYGFTPRTPDHSDPNCFHHTPRPPAALTDKQKVERLATWLNRRFGPRYHTNAATNGVRGPIYWAMVRKAGVADGLGRLSLKSIEATYFERGV